MFNAWLHVRERIFRARHPFPVDAWRESRTRLPLLTGLAEEDAQRLGQRAWRFLHDKYLSLHSMGRPREFDASFDMPARLALAAQTCLLTLGWTDSEHHEAFANIHEILILPDAFERQVVEMDESGVIHEYRDKRVGETSYQGPIVVSFPDLMASGELNGFNVMIHEAAHKIDMGNSEDADGFPPLPRDISSHEWHQVFTATWDDLQLHLKQGKQPPIGDYAASHPGECFAVCCEYFFAAPTILKSAYPSLYALLARYFRQDPLAWASQPAG